MPGPVREALHEARHAPGTPAAEPADGVAASLTVPGQAEQVPVARAFIARTLASCGLRGDTPCLLGSELVTNSVRHSNSRLPGGMVTVAVAATPAEVLVEVTDGGGPGVPVVRQGADLCAEGGRGLMLVAGLATRWGYQRVGGELTTWVQLPAEPCQQEDQGTAAPAVVPLTPSHTAEPAAGTFLTRDGRAADLFNLSHYPVRATCQVCGEQITAEGFIWPFHHGAPGEARR